ncbi:MAG: alpha/beta hydrolase [Ilumatobacter fluminis]|uniref:alpha/beta hydrolase n=1 Tax=Ilumatobacter fluminis TaxID=467091 RepID=UPI0032EFC33A
MDGTFHNAGYTLSCHVKLPPHADDDAHGEIAGMILCHGFPIGPLDARRSAGTFPQLVDRVAIEVGMPAMTFNFRGTGESTGDFSLQGWIDDLRAAIGHLCSVSGVTKVVLVGTNTGGSIAICVGADDPRVSAAALLSPRADFDDWADHPRRFLDHAREIGAVRTPGFPRSMDDWSRAFRRFRPVAAAQRFAPRPLMVMHGDDDDSVPTSDARQLAAAHGAAELSLLPGAGHRLRHDPRAVAILLGWLERVKTQG